MFLGIRAPFSFPEKTIWIFLPAFLIVLRRELAGAEAGDGHGEVKKFFEQRIILTVCVIT